MIGRRIYFSIGLSTGIWKPLYLKDVSWGLQDTYQRTFFVFASEHILVNKERFAFGLKSTKSERQANTGRRRLG